jgi:hypothetical protein
VVAEERLNESRNTVRAGKPSLDRRQAVKAEAAKRWRGTRQP